MSKEMRGWIVALCTVATCLGAGVAYVHSFSSELAVVRAGMVELRSDQARLESRVDEDRKEMRAELRNLRNKLTSVDQRVAILCAKLVGKGCER